MYFKLIKPKKHQFKSNVIAESIILAADRRFCCKHWKIARGRSGRYIIGKMVERICLALLGRHRKSKTMLRHCHVFKSGLFSIISESISSQSCFSCNTDL